MQKIRGAFRSSTIWFGFMVIAITWLENNTETLVGLVPSEYAGLAGYVVGLAIWFFRWITTKPLAEKVPVQKKEPTIAKERWEAELHKNDLEDF